MLTGAIVLDGGRGSRLGGVDKGSLVVGGRTLLAGVLEAVAAAGVPRARTVVVGPATPTPLPPSARDFHASPREFSASPRDFSLPDGVRRTREDPPLGGPLAALGAGLALLDDDARPADGDGDLLVLACDLPRAAALVPLLDVDLPADHDGVVVRDGDGRDQWLAARYRIAALREAIDAVAHEGPTGLTGLPLRAALRRLTLAHVEDPTGASLDVDTPADLTAARAAATMDVPSPTEEQR